MSRAAIGDAGHAPSGRFERAGGRRARTHVGVSLPDDARKQAIASVKRYFEERLEEEIGDLQAMLLLEFFLEEVAPTVYNQAVMDAQAYMQDRMGDLEASCYEPEFEYWRKQKRG